jgi:hypothetical protein
MSLNRASTQSLRMAERDGALLEQPAARTYEREDGLGSALGQTATSASFLAPAASGPSILP